MTPHKGAFFCVRVWGFWTPDDHRTTAEQGVRVAGMGPAPTGNARRRNATPAMTQLPAEGRGGEPAPPFPLGPDVATVAKLSVARDKVAVLEFLLDEGKSVEAKLDSARERVLVLEHIVNVQKEAESVLWAELWDTPQAVEWERLRWTREVAQYVRWKVLGENGDLDAAKEARQLGDRLGLTPMALQRLRWVVVRDELADQRKAKTTEPAAQKRPRNLKAVDDAG